MSNIKEQDNIETKLRKVKKGWTIFLFSSVILLTTVFILSVISLFPESVPDVETIHKPFSIEPILIGAVLFMFGLIILVTSSGFANSYHADKIVTPLFRDSNIIKSNTLTGVVKLKNDIEIQIQWSNKGYFVLANKNEPVAYAKSTELHWKLLYVSHKLSN